MAKKATASSDKKSNDKKSGNKKSKPTNSGDAEDSPSKVWKSVWPFIEDLLI
jgi:hypothetical protein